MNTAATDKTMRDVFIDALYEKMTDNDKIFFLSADFGAPSLDRLRKDFKDRFINVGIAEQNLINTAVGLALEDYIVYAYAIAPFITMRPYEQIRQNLAIASQTKALNVNLIGVGAGLSYGLSGPSHHCLEDISIMRTLPNFMVFSPSDWKLTKRFVYHSIKTKMPKYIRLDGKPLPEIYTKMNNVVFEQGFSELLKGNKVCLISTGFMTHQALKVAKNFQGVGVIDVFLLKPLNENLLFKALLKYRYLITLEEGFINKGGLDALVSKMLSGKGANIPLKSLGFGDKYLFEVGDRSYLHKLNKLDERNLVKIIKNWTK